MRQREFLLFCASGALGFLVDVGVLYGLAPWLGWYAARAASFVAAATFTWGFNRRLTFARHPAPVAPGVPLLRQYLLYLLSMAGGGLVNFAVYAVVLALLPGPWAGAAGVALGSAAGLMLNFLTARRLLAGKPPSQPT